MEKKINVVTGSFFYYKGKLIRDRGLSINVRDFFEKVLALPDDSLSAHDIVHTYNITYEKTYSYLHILHIENYIKYDLKSDTITIFYND